jgi:hypothetical protein
MRETTTVASFASRRLVGDNRDNLISESQSQNSRLIDHQVMKSVLCPNAVRISTEHLVPNVRVYRPAKGAGSISMTLVCT